MHAPFPRGRNSWNEKLEQRKNQHLIINHRTSWIQTLIHPMILRQSAGQCQCSHEFNNVICMVMPWQWFQICTNGTCSFWGVGKGTTIGRGAWKGLLLGWWLISDIWCSTIEGSYQMNATCKRQMLLFMEKTTFTLVLEPEEADQDSDIVDKRYRARNRTYHHHNLSL